MKDQSPRVIVIMGVAGSGKTTIGQLLAQRQGGIFFDADDFHPAVNVDKMAQGIPLNYKDRLPWLEKLRTEVIDTAPSGTLTVLACSALRHSYQEILGSSETDVSFVFLDGDSKTLWERISNREGHFMKPEMLNSQLEALESPSMDEAFHISILKSPQEIIEAIQTALFP